MGTELCIACRKCDFLSVCVVEYSPPLKIKYVPCNGEKQQRDEINRVIKFLRSTGTPESDIITKVMDSFHVTREYVLALLTPQKV